MVDLVFLVAFLSTSELFSYLYRRHLLALFNCRVSLLTKTQSTNSSRFSENNHQDVLRIHRRTGRIQRHISQWRGFEYVTLPSKQRKLDKQLLICTFCLVATENLNQWYSSGDQAFIIISSAMVLLMVPGLGFLYSGLARRKSALSMIWACMGSFSVVTFQWYFWGYSLAFSSSGTSGFIGDLQHFGLMNTLGAPSPGSPLIPELLYSFYQVWATPCLVSWLLANADSTDAIRRCYWSHCHGSSC